MMETLPDEILIYIIKFLVNTSNLALCSKRLYYLVCEATKNTIPLDLTCSDINDETVFNSIINSSRKFNSLTINLKLSSVLIDSTFERITLTLTKYGERLEELKIWSSIQSKPVEMSEMQLYKMFTLTPNVREITVRNIIVTQMSEIENDEELNLHKLNRLVLDYCMINSCSVFNKIPPNVIKELTFTFEPFDERNFQEFFNRQSTIKRLELYENEKINFDHLQLEHIKISSNIDYPRMIQTQSKLLYIDFAIAWVNEVTFTEVCKLKDLRVLKTLIDLVPLRAFKDLQNLTSLKELRLDSHSSYDMGIELQLSMMRGMQLEKLTLLLNERKINPEIVPQLANNYHHLKHIQLINRSIAILYAFIRDMPKLETILLDFFAVFGAPEDTLIINSEEEAKFTNLKQLIVTEVNVNEEENGRNLLKLVQMCPNIERLMLSKIVNFSNEELRTVLMFHKNMSHFSLETNEMDFDAQTVEIIFEFGHRIKHFRLGGIKSCFPYKVLKEIFSEKFPIINLYKYSSGESELIMRKRNVSDWHLSFKLMDHF